MSEIKLNLIDAQQIRHGNIHGSVADSAVAALSAEPETVSDLEVALARYIKPLTARSPLGSLRTSTSIDFTPWDAGLVIIDLAARIVAVESTYSLPGPAGHVAYHDGTKATDVDLMYHVPEDWVFVYSIAEYSALGEKRRKERAANPPLDSRAVLYGRPLLKWIVETMNSGEGTFLWNELARKRDSLNSEQDTETNPISVIHARWLMTPREDLRGQSPREVFFARRDFVDFDLNSREMQWTFLDEGPPCLSADSFAYRFAGFGSHEWVIYYDLVRHLLWSALLCQRLSPDDIQKLKRGRSTEALTSKPAASDKVMSERMDQGKGPKDIESAITELEEIKTAWLERPQDDYDSRTPAILIENERKRLPIALKPRDMIVDENCPTCQLFANDPSFGVGFWHLDGCNMDDDFAFSHHRTREEWEAERLEWRAFSEKFNREWEEKQQSIARGASEADKSGLSDVLFDADATNSDSSDTDDPGHHSGWGPRGWGVS